MMPGPRERFEKIPRGLYSDLLYHTLEALVEAVEPETHTCGECGSFPSKSPAHCVVLGADARDPACEFFIAGGEAVVPEPDIEALRIEYDREELTRELAQAKAEIERLRPLAEIGELVQNMGRETFFWRRFDGHYSARTLLLSKLTRPLLRSDFVVGPESRDPTDALRKIQEPSDAQA